MTLHTPVLLYKKGVQGGIHVSVMDMFSLCFFGPVQTENPSYTVYYKF